MQRTAVRENSVRWEGGFTLLELIGVLMVMAILATIMVPPFIERMKMAAAEHESADLQQLAQGLKNHILRNKHIPDEMDWAQVTATELGLQVGDVDTNSKGSPRVYLIDPAFRIGAIDGVLPYTQTSSGSVVEPAAGSWRLIILSSLDPAKLIPVSSGVIDAASFAYIWNAADDEVPAGWTGPWLNHGVDVRIQRINLAPLFKRLIVNNYGSPASGVFAIDAGAPGAIPAGGINTFLIEGTVVTLLDSNQVLESRHILRRPATFVYERGTWRGQVFQGLHFTDDGIYAASTLFLNSRLNADAASGATPSTLVDAMTGYMSSYANWISADLPGPGSPAFGALQTAQTTLKNVSANLIFKPTP